MTNACRRFSADTEARKSERKYSHQATWLYNYEALHILSRRLT